MTDTLGSLVSPENLFVVCLKDGTNQFSLAEDETKLPYKVDDVAFAANLTEIESLANEMKTMLTLQVLD